jgi:hypothetical protein
MTNLDNLATFPELSSADLRLATGGAAVNGSKWQEIRSEAAPHCPDTVAKFKAQPANRAQAQAMGASCISEMGPFKAGMGGRAKINEGIDATFPK